MGALPPVFIEFFGRAAGFHATARGVKAELATVETSGGRSMAKLGGVSKAALLGIGAGAIEVALKTTKMAADFETQMTRVRTGAGEAAGSMKLVSDGVLAMAGQVGQSTTHLTAGLYTVESAGYHGADALGILKVSAQGAKVGVAELATVTDAVTTGLNAYKLGAGEATHVMNALVATEANGKTNLEALAGSMASILPVSAAAHVGLNEVLGAMATMTSQGTSANVAATYLRQTIGMLSNPSAKAATTMKGLGLSAIEVSQNLGKNGLASTLTMLTDAIEKHMGPAGTVMVETLRKASTNTTEYQKVLANLPPAQKTFIGALATMVGGTKSMMGALQLTGTHMENFKHNTAAVAEQVKKGGHEVEGWADVQKTLNQKTAEAKASMGALGIEIGQHLMPIMSKITELVARAATYMASHQKIAQALAYTIGVVLVLAVITLTAALWNMAAAAWATGIPEIILAVVMLIAWLVFLALHWRQIWAIIKEVGLAIVHALVSSWNWLKDETLSIWGSITGGIASAWNSVAAFFVSAWHSVADPIVGAWRWVSSVTSAVWGGISSFFAKWWPLLLVIFLPWLAALIGAWNRWHSAIWSALVSAWNGVAGFFVGIWNWIAGLASFVWQQIADAVVGPSKTTGAWLKKQWSTVAGWVSSSWQWLLGIGRWVWAQIRAAIVDPMVSAWHSLVKTFDSMKSSIHSKLVEAWNSVKEVGSWFRSIGSDIVWGIIHGVESAGGYLKDKLRNLAGDALDAAKSFLDINSPSKKFSKVVGKAIPEGIAHGVGKYAHIAISAVKSLASDSFGAADGSVGIGGNVRLGMGTSGGSGTVVNHTHVHVEVHGSVRSDRDLREVVQEEMLRNGARNSGTWQPYKL